MRGVAPHLYLRVPSVPDQPTTPIGQLLVILEQLPTPALLLDRGLVVRAHNHAAAQLFATSSTPGEKLSAGKLIACLHRDQDGCCHRAGCDTCPLREAVTDTVDMNQRTQAREIRLACQDGADLVMRMFLLGSSPLELPGTKLALVTLQDLSSQARTTDRTWMATRLTMFDSVDVGIAVVDPRLGQLVHANPKAVVLLRVPAGGIQHDACRALCCGAQEGDCPVMDRGASCDISERQLPGEGGEPVDVQVTSRPLLLEGRQLVVESFQVLTERRAVERVVQRHNERLEALLELGRKRDEDGGDVLAWALEEAIKLTHSSCGYLYFVDKSQQSLKLHSFAGEPKGGRLSKHPKGVDMYEAGIWADCLRLVQPVTHNRYPKSDGPAAAYPASFRVERQLSVPITEGGRVAAVLGVGDKAEDYDETDAEQLSLFTTSVWDLLRRRQAEGRLRSSVANLRLMLRGTTEAITRAIEIRDPYTAGHQRRVSDLARALATKLGLTGPHVDAIRIAAMLHDIGKIAVPADILTKPSRLTALEFRLLQQHPVQSFEILEHVAMPFPIHTIVRAHHERLDGSGYPDGLAGPQIGSEARILAVADVMEAMVSHRPYRPAHSVEEALAELRRLRKTALDARVVDACRHLFIKDGYTFPT